MAYTRRSNKKSYLKKKMMMKRKSVPNRTRRYRPRRTYRRTYKRSKCGEGSVLTGNSYGKNQKLFQVFKITDTNGTTLFFNQDGTILTPPFVGFQITKLKTIPGDHIGLVQRFRTNKYWRITGVKYHFYKDSTSPNNGAIAYANYNDEYDNLHSKVVYNPNLDTPPDPGLTFRREFGNWLTQQKGQLLPTLNKMKKNVYCKAMMNKLVKYQSIDGQERNEKQLVPFPWINTEISNLGTTEYATGFCDAYMPVISLVPLLQNPSFALLGADSQQGLEARLRVAQKFQWYYRVQCFWQVKGKYYDNVTQVTPPSAALDNMKIEDDLSLTDEDTMHADFGGVSPPKNLAQPTLEEV